MMTCPHCHKFNQPDRFICYSCEQFLHIFILKIVGPQERNIQIKKKNICIGRNSDNDIVLDDGSVSRYHTCLRFTDNHSEIEDLDSKNGLFLNGTRIKKKNLKDCDCVQIGRVRGYFYIKNYDAAHYFKDTAKAFNSGFVNPGQTFETTLTPKSYHKMICNTSETLFGSLLKIVLRGVLKLAGCQFVSLWMVDSTGDLVPRMWLFRDTDSDKTSADYRSRVIQSNGNHEELSNKVYHNCSILVQNDGKTVDTTLSILTDDLVSSYDLLGVPFFLDDSDKNKKNGSVPMGVIVLDNGQALASNEMSKLKKLIANSGAYVKDALYCFEQLKMLFRKGEHEKFHSLVVPTVHSLLPHEVPCAIEIQKYLRPVAEQPHPGYGIAYWGEKSGVICGDYLDLIEINENETVIAVGDIAGKGVLVAYLLNLIQAGLRLQLFYECQPLALLEALNQVIYEASLASTFMTLFIAVLNRHTRVMRYINAGHTPGIMIYQADRCRRFELLRNSGTALGVLEANKLQEQQCKFPCGSALVLFTDGITERTDIHKNQYGLKRLTQQIMIHSSTDDDLKADELLNSIKEALPPSNISETKSSVVEGDQTLLVLVSQ